MHIKLIVQSVSCVHTHPWVSVAAGVSDRLPVQTRAAVGDREPVPGPHVQDGLAHPHHAKHQLLGAKLELCIAAVLQGGGHRGVVPVTDIGQWAAGGWCRAEWCS